MEASAASSAPTPRRLGSDLRPASCKTLQVSDNLLACCAPRAAKALVPALAAGLLAGLRRAGRTTARSRSSRPCPHHEHRPERGRARDRHRHRPEGTNSHTSEPAPSDARAMAEADVVFMNGLHLEEPTRELAEANVADGVEIVELGSMTIDPDEYIYDFVPARGRRPEPAPVDEPALREALRADRRTSSPISTPTAPTSTSRTTRRSPSCSTSSMPPSARRPTPSRPRTGSCSRTTTRSPYFAREYGWDDRRDPALRLCGTHRPGRREPDRPGPLRAGAGDLRVRGLPEQRSWSRSPRRRAPST